MTDNPWLGKESMACASYVSACLPIPQQSVVMVHACQCLAGDWIRSRESEEGRDQSVMQMSSLVLL